MATRGQIVLGFVVLLLLCLIFIFDLDGDGVIGWEEAVKYSTDPTPVVGYDKNLKLLKDAVDFIDVGLIHGGARELHTKAEIESIQNSLIIAVLDDKTISDVEATVLDELIDQWSRWRLRWWIVRDIFASGMINDEYLQENWDGDENIDGNVLSNYEEIIQGTNPLETLETRPDKLSERYVVMTGPVGDSGNEPRFREICQKFLKNGYDDDHIYLTLNPGERDATNFPVIIDHIGQSVELSTASVFLRDVKKLPSDGNDIVFVYTDSHGNENVISIGGNVRPSELNTALYEMQYGRAILVVHASKAGGFVDKFNDRYYCRYELPNILGISTQNRYESGNIDFINIFLEYMDCGLNLKSAFEETTHEMNNFGNGYHPEIHFGSAEDFTNPLKYLKTGN